MELHSPDPSRSMSHGRGVIEAIVGHQTGRGIPEAFEITLRNEDGSVLQARMPTPTGRRLTANILPIKPEFFDFGRCPICLVTDPTSREHVPPSAIGGRILTLTCLRCNNEFGSRFEPSLLAFYEGSLGQSRFSGGSMLGHRRGGSMLLRTTEDGTPVLIETGRSHPDIDEILAGGTATVQINAVDGKSAHMAAVKSAYLAACLFMREIPMTPRGEAIRSELVRARDRRRDEPWQLSPLLQSIKLLPSDATREPGEVRLVHIDEHDGSQTLAISFNHAFAVEWPLEAVVISNDTPPSDNLT